MNRLRPLFAAALSGLFAHSAGATVIEGHVRSAAGGQPIAGARVSLVTWFMGFPGTSATVQSGADGSYRFDLPENYSNAVRVAAEAPGHAPLEHAGLSCANVHYCASGASALPIGAGTLTTVDFSLPVAARITGRTIDAVSGTGVQATQVVLHNTAAGQAHLNYLTTTQADGSFQLENLHPGNYRLDARPTGQASNPPAYLRYVWPDQPCDDIQQSCADLAAAPVSLAAGGDGGNYTVRLQRGAVVRVRMLSLGNGSSIQQQTRLSSVSTPGRYDIAHSTADGYAYIGALMPGEVRLALEPVAVNAYPAIVHPNLPCTGSPCDVSGAPSISVPAATLVTAADVYVAPLRSIRGRVTDGGGQGLTGVPVAAGTLYPQFFFGYWGFNTQATAVSGEDGDFQLEGFAEDTPVVRTQHGQQGWIDGAWPGTVCDGQNLFCENENASYTRVDFSQNAHPGGIDLVITPATTLEGRVVDQYSGEAKANWHVAVIPASANRLSKSVLTDAQGRFRLAGLTSEAYYLWASAVAPYSHTPGTVYPDRHCFLNSIHGAPNCDLAAATAVTPTGAGLDNLVISVPRADALFRDSFENVE